MTAVTEHKTIDGNEAVAHVAYRLSEIIPIYPITPATSMAELCDEWSSKDKRNLWGQIPQVIQMQCESGAAGTLHGALMAGSQSTTFTASQGLLLMIPIMYKLAGELMPTVIHVSSRAVATNSLSIFCDHSDVMACRQTGFAMLASNSVQEAQDMAAIAHAATLRSRVPFLHFFDGFRTSHEFNSVVPLTNSIMDALIDESALDAFYRRALTPDDPTIRGTAQDPDTYFQTREAVNGFYNSTPEIVQTLMDEFAHLTGRSYKLFDYYGHPEAEQVIVLIGSGVETATVTAEWLNANAGCRYGVLAVRLYRPFHVQGFLQALPGTVKAIAVLDRTKEPGAVGEPLYLDVSHALREARRPGQHSRSLDPVLVGGRYGLGSKEFTPAMVKAVYENLLQDRPVDHFSVGIRDDVTGQSLDWDPAFKLTLGATKAAVFYGLSSDGTVGASKNSIKIIGDRTNLYTQAFFVYGSHKSGGLTASHLRYGPTLIKAPYLVQGASFVGCHQPQFLGRVDMLSSISRGGVFLLNSPTPAQHIWEELPRETQQRIIDQQVEFHVIDAYKVAHSAGSGCGINVIMQVCFFALSNLLAAGDAIASIKAAIKETYNSKGPEIVNMNLKGVNEALANLHRVSVPAHADSTVAAIQWVPESAPDFVKTVTSRLLAGQGDLLPVSAFPVDGVWPTATSQYEKRSIATRIPVWEADTCYQCNKCSLFCPHAAIRPKYYPSELLDTAPETFPSVAYKGENQEGKSFTIQVYPQDCTGCNACVEVCPAINSSGRRAIEMEELAPILDQEKENLAFFENLPQPQLDPVIATSKNVGLGKPLFEFSGACSGCGQTPYISLLTRLFGDRLLIANATGCSSIYGANLPTTPYSKDEYGRGPAWANSLFEDNAEFGLGLHLAAKRRHRMAHKILNSMREELGGDIVDSVLGADPRNFTHIREKKAELRKKLGRIEGETATMLRQHLDYLVKKSTWIIGGDGWAYDIGFGGLDHVLATGQNINVLVLDSEVYSNTGGQSSKATPIGAQAKFSAQGKIMPKKDLGQIVMTYGGIYVGQVALGANEQQTVEVFKEAESYDGPSLILAYTPCIAHGVDLAHGPERQKAATESGYWPLYRYDPRNAGTDIPAFRLDSFEPSLPVADFMMKENRFQSMQRSNSERADLLIELAQTQVNERWAKLEKLAAMDDDDDDDGWG